ncbi:MAG: ATP-binding cassette domain-containing protein [Burkholderiaceae bacterium]
MPLNQTLDVSDKPAPLVQATGLGVCVDGRWLIRGVDISISPGEIVTLIGPNGSGKSTTVRSILGLIKPQEGSIHRRAGLRIGYVPQRVQIDPILPVNVSRLMTLTNRYSNDQVAQALSAVGLAGKQKQAVQELSGGEFQRVLLARALAGKPDLLVLDEPVQGVDFTGEIQLYDLIQSVREQTGCGVLLVSHDLHVVMAKTDSVICLNGHVCCHGTPQMVADNPEYIRLFGPRGADALAIYQHDHDHTHLPDGGIACADASPHHHHHSSERPAQASDV